MAAGEMRGIVTISVALASPEEMRSWSSGEIKTPETVDFRTLAPIRGGLYCEQLFAPIEGWACPCRPSGGAPLWIVTDVAPPGLICPSCGMETDRHRLYCKRMGHVELAAPVPHPWFSTGGSNASRPEAVLLNVLPVLPPDLRPMKRLDENRFAISHLNDLYRRVLNRNNRLRKLIDLPAPDPIIDHEKQMLAESLDTLVDNGRRADPVRDRDGKPLKSLADALSARLQARSPGSDPSPAGRMTVNIDAALAGVPRFAEIIGDRVLRLPTTPRSLWSLVHHLRALGLKTTFEASDGRTVAPEELAQSLEISERVSKQRTPMAEGPHPPEESER